MDPISRVVAAGAAGASGAAAGPALYVDDVFSTYLYDGNGSLQTITNGIDLDGEGGLVWIKHRNAAEHNALYDTERGTNKELNTNANFAEKTKGPTIGASGVYYFGASGFNVGGISEVNSTSQPYASWTFRKAPGFFDIVTYTGNDTAGRQISHSLGSTPGMIIVKNLTNAWGWNVYHRGIASDAETDYLQLNTTAAASDDDGRWNDTAPTSSVFTVGTGLNVNASGNNYVAYLFAHDDQSFGTNSDESIIKCGSVTTGSDEYATVNLGFEPQFVMFKRTDVSGDWLMLDTMRGWNLGNDDQRLYANLSNAESTTSSGHGEVNSTGFRIYNLGGSADLIYVAIRRPHKPPEAGTDVFAIDKLSGSQSSPAFRTGIVTDMGWARRLSNGSYYGTGVGVYDRLRGEKFLSTGSDAAEGNDSFDGDYMNGFYSSALIGDIGYSFKRAAGFFDIVAYTGGISGSPASVTHNLDAVPELMIVKKRSFTQNWWVYHSALGNTGRLILSGGSSAISNSTDWGSTTPTSSVFYIGNNTNDGGGSTYIAYLFATLAGISKVGSYTGTGSNINVDCGFTAGARFVFIKRSDDTGSWFFWDSTRGIVSGNDPYILLNTSDSEVTNTDYLDPLNAGFTVTSSAPAALNTSGGTYVFFAIA